MRNSSSKRNSKGDLLIHSRMPGSRKSSVSFSKPSSALPSLPKLSAVLQKLPASFKPHLKTLKRLSSPKKIQKFLDDMPLNWEKGDETYMSVQRTLRGQKAHCLEAALLAALALWIQGQPPLILDLKSSNGDDHIVALYKRGGRWGAISKTNHSTLRFRDPVYETSRELAMSYFHEYIHTKTGEKILESFSEPFDLRKVSKPNVAARQGDVAGGAVKDVLEWIIGEDELFWLAEAIDESPHVRIYPAKNKKHLRRADHMELKAGNLIEWKKSDKRT